MRVRRIAAVLGLLLAALLASCAGTSIGPSPAGPTPRPSPTRWSGSLSPSPSPVVERPSTSPSPSLQTYVISSGDTIAKIAERYGLTVDELLAANTSISNPDLIRVGQVITIPEASFELVLEAANAAGQVSQEYVHALVDEVVAISIAGPPGWAGGVVYLQVYTQGAGWRDYGGFDATGKAMDGGPGYTGAITYRARAPASDQHPEMISNTLVVEWGGSGQCPAAVYTGRPEPVVIPDGTTYTLVAGMDTEYNRQWSIVASTVAGDPSSGWVSPLEPCWEPIDAVADDDSRLYLALAEEPGHRMRLLVATPQGSRIEGELWGPFWLTRSPDGSVYAVSNFADYGCGEFDSLSVAAIGPDAKPKAGWPYTTTELTSGPTFGRDGTLYLAQSTDAGDLIIALGSDGRVKEGWPYELPGSFERYLCEDWPHAPSVAPDGSIFDAFDAGVYMVGPDGAAKRGWPYLLPSGTSIARAPKTGTPCCATFDPILTDDGRIYLPRADDRYAARHQDMMCLLLDGSLCDGWPVKLPEGTSIAGFEIDGAGTVYVTVLDDGDLELERHFAIDPDGTLDEVAG